MNQTGTIGIVGGGQLGRMLTEAALPMGFKVIVVDPNDNCPAAQAGAQQIKADFTDEAAILSLAEQADYISIESEHVNAEALDKIAAHGKPVNPSPQTVAMIQDKLKQKQFLDKAGVPVADFMEISNMTSAGKAMEYFGYQMLIKTRHGGFDGRGNAYVDTSDKLYTALEKFDGKDLYAEKFVPFVKELAVVMARDVNGNVKVYPVVETIHRRNICVEVIAPAQVDKAIADKAEAVALNVAQHLEGAGVFGIEMFLTEDGEVMVNEIAPRVHNSGHLTIEACETSQFEQHIRGIAGMELGSTDMKVPAAVMVNILGDHDGPANPQGLEEAAAEKNTHVHIYGKAQTRVDRKMGHITATGDTIEEARQRAHAARAAITI